MISVDLVKQANAGNATALAIDYPLASEVQGNTPPDTSYSVYVAVICTRPAGASAPSITGPAGWTLVDSVGNLDAKLEVFYKAFDASTGSASWTTNHVAQIVGSIILLSGVNLSSPAPITVFDDATSAFTALHSVGPVTTAYDNSELIGCWLDVNSQIIIVPPTGMTILVQTIGSNPAGLNSLLVAHAIQGTAGGSGTKTATSTQSPSGSQASGTEAMLLVAVNPYLGPSAPVIIQPDGGNQITQGAAYSITWTASTHPTVAQGSLQYHIQYSDNAGVSWSDIVALTSAGVTTHSWSTAGRSIGSLYRIRIRCWDGTRFGPYDTSAANFSIIADQTPGAPLNVHAEQAAGTTVTGVFDRASAMRLAWTHNDIGDPQTGYEIRHSVNADMSSPTTITQTSANQYHDFNTGLPVFSHTTIYFDVRTKDTAGTFGPRSSVFSIVAGDKPATPNITAPTAGSPPTVANPAVTWTSSGQVKYKIRVVLSGSEVFNTGFVTSTALSRALGYNLTTGLSYTLFLSIQNSDGLNSNEDSETFTVSFTGPATPTIDVTAVGEALQIAISNSDTPDHVDLLRDGVRIVEGMGVDPVFLDRNVASGVTYSYVARAFSASGLFTDSAADTGSLTLDKAWLHVVTRDSVTANAVTGTIVGLGNLAPMTRTPRRRSDQKKCVGRPAPLPVFGQLKSQAVAIQIRIAASETTTRDTIRAAQESNSDVCVRDQYGNMVFGRLTAVRESRSAALLEMAVEIEETDYSQTV